METPASTTPTDADERPAPEENPTSAKLALGEVYTRDELKLIFGIRDATIYNGVYRPRDTCSIWLFVTRRKTADRTPYDDSLEGDVLRWQGQMRGRTDRIIVEHEARGLELLVFYRDRKYEHAGAGFRYEGAFRYRSHEGAAPTGFVFERLWGSELTVEGGDGEPFDPASVEDGRSRILGMVRRRQGQAAFRRLLLEAYERRCAISGCDVEAVLQAAHIHPYLGSGTNAVSNGLLLRADLHTLFDLGLIRIAEDGRAIVSDDLKGTPYFEFQGVAINRPAQPYARPSPLALRWHRENA